MDTMRKDYFIGSNKKCIVSQRFEIIIFYLLPISYFVFIILYSFTYAIFSF